MSQHLAVVMDGNRRWAQQRGLATFLGHKNGAETVRTAADFCLTQGIKFLSLYTLSLENLHRSAAELDYIYHLVTTDLPARVPEFIANQTKIKFLGDLSFAPAYVQTVCQEVEQATASFDRLQLNFLFCYGARQELVAATQKISALVLAGQLAPEQITMQTVSDNLWTAGIPDPDLIMRPGDRLCASNFLLYQSAYTELYFTPKLWPELTTADFAAAWGSLAQRRRSFGR